MLAMTADFLSQRHVIDLGKAWAGNTVNCVPYRSGPVLTEEQARYVAFYDEAGNIRILRHDLIDDTEDSVVIPNTLMPYDAHQSISMGFDGAGILHLAFGAHATTLLATRSRTSDLKDGFEPVGDFMAHATYPMFLRLPKGDFLFLYREGRHNVGEMRVAHYNPEAGEWRETMTPVLSGKEDRWTSGPYVNTPVVDEQGNVHLFVVWRLHVTSTSGGEVINSGLDYLLSTDGLRTVQTGGGMALSMPVTRSNIERVVPVPLGSSLMNQASAQVMSGDRPAAMTYWAEPGGVPQYRLCWSDGHTWRTAALSRFLTAFRLDGQGTLPLPHSRPEFVVTDDDNVIVIYRSVEEQNRLMARLFFAPNYDYAFSQSQVLIDEDLGFYEPVIDRSGWKMRGELSIYVQHCRQGMSRDGEPDRHGARARLVTWTYRSNPAEVLNKAFPSFSAFTRWPWPQLFR
ncbi:BNR-4 repeat-containing protein [Ensifer soli]|uniref:BNR-4 repeat-containing protein n=1 Tax=Ciceribacter sp. sgz301302 TaxID=3342379 RepID=UPI0035B8379F